MQRLGHLGGADRSCIVLSRGASSTTGSSLDKESYDWVRARPEIEQRAGTALVSPEMITQTQLRTSSGVSLFVGVHGVDPVAYQVHDVRVIKGRLPQPDTDEVLIGKTLDGVFPGFSVGGAWNKHPIVGVFASGGSLTEQEIWMDRKRLAVELGRRATNPIQFAFAKTRSPADAAKLVDEVNKSKQPLSAFTESDYLKKTSGDSSGLIRLGMVLSMLLALGAGIAAVNTLYSSLLGRQSELATLFAIGVRRRRLAALILQESIVLAILGTIVGIAIPVALEGQQVARLWTDHPFEQFPLHVGATSIFAGIAIGLVVGVAGGLVPGISIFRVDMRKSLG
jgi:ABC-type lipoprotein release transport system permease subunit